MANQTLNTLLMFRAGLSSAWQASNITLNEGEPGYETDTHILKIGDGVTAYNDLPAVSGDDSLAEQLQAHLSNYNNPHQVTKAQIGLGNVDNTSDADKPVSTATQAALDLKANISDIPTDVLQYSPQSLTAEQQAQARANIGAGASDFSGSYEDLNNKPILNSSNTQALTPLANEEINGALNLHKVSKTGNYADLNGLPVIPTNTSQLTNDSNFITTSNVASTGSYGIIQIASDLDINTGTNTTKAVTPKQLRTAIDGLGDVFTIKGSVATADDLPASGNSVGDVWYVQSESVGYIWLNDDGTLRWEQLGPTINLSAYVAISSIVDNLTTSATDQPLSANQGVVLNQLISANTAALATKANAADIPTKVSQLSNDSGYIKNELNAFSYSNLSGTPTIPTQTSQLTNDSGFVTSTQLATKVDKVSGKGLSTNDFTNDYLSQVTSNTASRHTHSNKQTLDTITSTQEEFNTAISQAQSTGAAAQSNLTTHINNQQNPHKVTASQVGLGNVDNVKQYSAQNPPPYPVTSVAGKTGSVTLGTLTIQLNGSSVGTYNGSATSTINLSNVYTTSNKPTASDLGIATIVSATITEV